MYMLKIAGCFRNSSQVQVSYPVIVDYVVTATEVSSTQSVSWMDTSEGECCQIV